MVLFSQFQLFSITIVIILINYGFSEESCRVGRGFRVSSSPTVDLHRTCCMLLSLAWIFGIRSFFFLILA